MKKSFWIAMALLCASFCFQSCQTTPVSSPYKYRTAYNYCTYGYTFSYWTWTEWEKEINRLADHGFNQALLLPGHEKVWQNVLRRVGMPDSEILAFIPAQPYTPWWLMGNLEGLGGPISQKAIDAQAELGRKMADKMRERGIAPIVNGFCGIVPCALPKYVKGRYVDQGKWCSLPRPTLLSPLDPAFPKLAEIWYEEAEKVWGDIQFFGGDLFHEGGRSGGLNVGDCACAVQTAMLKAHPNAIYVLQNWHGNPSDAFIKGLDVKHVMVQQLVRDQKNFRNGPRYRTFHGADWTVATVNNFGGNHGLYGNLRALAKLPAQLKAAETQNCQGLAILDEGFQRNPVVEALWYKVIQTDTNIDLNAFLKEYTEDRYGVDASDIFLALADDIYNVQHMQEGVTDFIIATKPHDTKMNARYWCNNKFYWDLNRMVSATDSLLKLDCNTPGYYYDCIDFIRECLDGYAYHVRMNIVEARKRKDLKKFDVNMKRLIGIFNDLEIILAHAKAEGYDFEPMDCPEKFATLTDKRPEHAQNLRRLFTTWTPDEATSLNDYASRTAYELIPYYRARWEAWGEQQRNVILGKPTQKIDYQAIADSFIQNGFPQKAAPEGGNLKNTLQIFFDYNKGFIEELTRAPKK